MTPTPPITARDPFDPRLARRAPPELAMFNEAGVLAAADVHVATRLAALVGGVPPAVVLAIALAVRAPRASHVCCDLASIERTATSDLDPPEDVSLLPWPAAESWIDAVGASPLVAVGEDAPPDRPLRLVGSRLYLDRYWHGERAIAADVRERATARVEGIDERALALSLRRLFPEQPGHEPDLQRVATAAAVLRRFSVIAGGPGTGKTTTVARLLALLDELASAGSGRLPLVALAAPTGKAAARLEEAVHAEARRLDVEGGVRDRLLSVDASTLHRLLGWRPDSHSRFRHNRQNKLPHDVVVVDEMSMVSLSLMAKLAEAVRADARLVLLGDPDQLASVEAGAVLGDVVGPVSGGLLMSADTRRELAALTGHDVPAADPPAGSALGDGIVVLRRVHRFGDAIARLATAVQSGDADEAIAVLAAGDGGVQWIDGDVSDPATRSALEPVRAAVVRASEVVTRAARAGADRQALDGLHEVRVLCAHRRGAYGVATWMAHVERWLRSAIDGYGDGGHWYAGRPLLVTANDYGLRLYNGDTGVIVMRDGQPRAVFERQGELLEVSPTRLAAVETVHAMTIHKSQGSQFQMVAVLLPDETSPILTRELLYTAITRARNSLVLAGSEASVRAAVTRPIARASGLRDRLWTANESIRTR
ncbi:MAG: exodeoxyribonuclease V subunit alpha [Actinobacteria bacterium]|nr:exodeoxyribonuclease V subunit alpha [Actinomycetota bacterium]